MYENLVPEKDGRCQNCRVELKRRQTYFCSIRCSLLWRNTRLMLNKEVRETLSSQRKGLPNGLRGFKHSEQSRRNMSAAHVGKPSPKKGIKTGKPSWITGKTHTEETKEKIRRTKIRLGQGGTRDCGNGRPLPREHQALYDILSSSGWIAELPIPTKEPRGSGYPSNYKVDLGYEADKLAIEVDGPAHTYALNREVDKKKDEKLAQLGWTVIRVSNAEALTLSALTAKEILARLFK